MRSIITTDEAAVSHQSIQFGSREHPFLTSSLVMPMMLIQVPHSENQCCILTFSPDPFCTFPRGQSYNKATIFSLPPILEHISPSHLILVFSEAFSRSQGSFSHVLEENAPIFPHSRLKQFLLPHICVKKPSFSKLSQVKFSPTHYLIIPLHPLKNLAAGSPLCHFHEGWLAPCGRGSLKTPSYQSLLLRTAPPWKQQILKSHTMNTTQPHFTCSQMKKTNTRVPLLSP